MGTAINYTQHGGDGGEEGGGAILFKSHSPTEDNKRMSQEHFPSVASSIILP